MSWRIPKSFDRTGDEERESGDWYESKGRGTIFVNVAIDTRDDGFHEIQLNGKQLVFLFMAATVVSVVIFLCGVLVGRGAGVAGTLDPISSTPMVMELPTESTTAEAREEVASTESAPVDGLDYYDRLERQVPAVEELSRPTASPAPSASPPSRSAATERREPAPAARPVAAATTEARAVESASPPSRPAESRPAATLTPAPVSAQAAPPAGDWAVQIAALNDSGDADAMAKAWGAKGYPAYVVTPLGGASVYRVRIGTFKTRREADAVASRLQREERISPWVTR